MGYKLKRILIYPDGVTEKQVYPNVPPYLCFTANTAGSTVALNKLGSPTAVTLETSTDGQNWSTYTFSSTITLSNVGDKVYFRNTSETTTGFSLNNSNYYRFTMTGSIAGSGDVMCLLNKNLTTNTSAHCFYSLFYGCTSLITAPNISATSLMGNCCYYMFQGCTGLTKAPKISATTVDTACCSYMFYGCSNLEELPLLQATTLATNCYSYMFYNCSKIKLSTTQTGEYQTTYTIPSGGSGTVGSNSLKNMFTGTGGTFTGTPSINTTYYTSNTLV